MRFFVALLLVFAQGCSKKEEKPVEKERPVYNKPDAGDNFEMKPMKKVQILVGGCLENCSEARESLFNYLSALRRDPSGGEAMKFINSVELVYNGHEKGREWAQMWKEMRANSRIESIGEFAKAMGEWVKSVESEEAFQRALLDGIEVKELWTTRAVMLFHPPPLKDGTYAQVWRYELKTRGLEWLITGIADRNAPN
ncbi:MAG: hypothetical protein FJ088_00915 [Deltaproteobacteria bacterium]|nr:hypothetical protein [Deltaproteobacteria bacterium]